MNLQHVSRLLVGFLMGLMLVNTSVFAMDSSDEETAGASSRRGRRGRGEQEQRGGRARTVPSISQARGSGQYARPEVPPAQPVQLTFTADIVRLSPITRDVCQLLERAYAESKRPGAGREVRSEFDAAQLEFELCVLDLAMQMARHCMEALQAPEASTLTVFEQGTIPAVIAYRDFCEAVLMALNHLEQKAEYAARFASIEASKTNFAVIESFLPMARCFPEDESVKEMIARFNVATVDALTQHLQFFSQELTTRQELNERGQRLVSGMQDLLAELERMSGGGSSDQGH